MVENLQVHPFGNSEGVTHLDSKIANGAFQLRVTERYLDGPEVNLPLCKSALLWFAS